MSATPDPSLCYGKDADDKFRTYCVNPWNNEFMSLGGEAVLKDLPGEIFDLKLELLKRFFKSSLNPPDISSVYDIRYSGRPNERHLYDILFLPGFASPAYKLSIAVLGDQVRRLDWRVYLEKEFSPIDPGLYGRRFQILKSDLAACRLSGIEILKDRLTPGGFEEWLREAGFHDETPKRKARA